MLVKESEIKPLKHYYFILRWCIITDSPNSLNLFLTVSLLILPNFSFP